MFGVRGWFRVHSYTEPRDALLGYRDWLLKADDTWRAVSVTEGRVHGRAIVVRLAGIDDRDAAAAYVGMEIAVRRDQLPAAGPGEYYWADLIGMKVCQRDGREVGRVSYLLATGAHDVLAVQAKGEERREVLIPFVMEKFILGVDLAAGVIHVDWEWE